MSTSTVEDEKKTPLPLVVLTLTLDVGASIGKAIYSLKSSNPQRAANEFHYMYMDSEMIEVTESMLIDFETPHLVDSPEKSAWVKWKAKDEKIYAFGLLAKKLKARKKIHAVKYEDAIGKCAAFIGAIVKKHSLESHQLDLIVNLLIPYNELKSRQTIEANLKKTLPRFYFQNILIKAKLVQFRCLPEGFGGLLNRVNLRGRQWLSQSKIAVIMIGHRNCSCLVLEQGSLYHGETIDFGFFDLIKEIQKNSIGQNVNDLEFIVPLIGKNGANADKVLPALLRSSSSDNKEKELISLKETISNSRQKIWQLIANWLDGQIPKALNETMIFGGASHYFHEELEKFCGWSNIYWGKDIADKISNLESEELPNSTNLAIRFIDVYGLHKTTVKEE